MKKVKVWDGKSKVNNISVEELKSRYSSTKLLLVYEEGVEDLIILMADIKVVKSNLGMGKSTDNEVIAKYQEDLNFVPIKEEPLNITDTELAILEGQAMLFEQNAQLLIKLEELKPKEEEPIVTEEK